MAFLDFLLNLIGLALWLAGCGFARDTTGRGALTLASNLKPAESRPESRWPSFVMLAGLLLFRPVVYWHLGRILEWTAIWSPGAVTVMFRSDHFGRMMLYSFTSFGWALFTFYSWLIVLSATNGGIADQEPITKRICQQLGPVGRLPAVVKVVLPFFVLALIWWVASWVFVRNGLMPPVKSTRHAWQQLGVVALGAPLSWKWLIAGVLLLRFLNTYVYLGNHLFWDFIQVTGRRWLYPIGWMRLGKLDVAALVGLVGIWVFLTAFEHGGRFALSRLYATLPR